MLSDNQKIKQRIYYKILIQYFEANFQKKVNLKIMVSGL